MLKYVTLTLADRQLIRTLIQNIRKVTVDDARYSKEIRSRFELKAAKKKIDEMEFDRQREIFKARKEMEEKLKGNPNAEVERIDLVGIDWDDLHIEPKEYTIDSVYIDKLQEWMKERDWTSWPSQERPGETIHVPATESQMDAIADLAQAIKEASEVSGREK